MRDIKFRGKDLLSEWRHGDLVQEKWGQGKAIMIKKDKRAWNVLEETVGQYTGLKDKNGKEIYEGDIINDGGTIYKVLYYLDGFSAEVIKTKEDEEQIPDIVYSLANFDNGCRVIGNIYDNPELLAEKE